jgi:N-methylhydantoinase B/oxoprolinase/acetone carboxylase alpha subunit
VRVETGGGGGWGAPAERNPVRVVEDVANGFVSETEAREVYGLAVRNGKWVPSRGGPRRRKRAFKDDAP